MKTLRLTSAIICFMLGSNAWSQTKPDSLGLPGDNFDLYGALELFKKADSPEAFEKALNAKDNEVNNLDLDGDGKVDYVKVIDKKDGDAHTLVLQVDVSQTEKQDVAVIELEKTGDDKAHVQIVGDEELYGKDYIVEPTDEKNEKAVAKQQSANKGSNDDVYSTSDDSNRSPNVTNNNTTNNYYNDQGSAPNVYVNVWGWPSVRYIYGPSYAVWVSPWYWRTYPVWWDPWAPVYWRYHYRRTWRYHHPYYHRVSYYRSPRVHNWYYGRRTSSQTVRGHRESGFYHQKQMMYKDNVQPGRKYNSQPARRDGYQKQNMQQQQQPQRNGGYRQQQNLQNQQGVKQQPMQKQPGQQQPVRQQQMQQQPMRQQQPVKQQPMRQQMPQQQAPKQHMQQQMPRQGGGGGGGGRNGGGGMHSGSGSMHRR